MQTQIIYLFHYSLSKNECFNVAFLWLLVGFLKIPDFTSKKIFCQFAFYEDFKLKHRTVGCITRHDTRSEIFELFYVFQPASNTKT